MGETKAHGVEVAGVERLAASGRRKKGSEVLANATVEVEELAVVGDLDAKLLGDVGSC